LQLLCELGIYPVCNGLYAAGNNLCWHQLGNMRADTGMGAQPSIDSVCGCKSGSICLILIPECQLTEVTSEEEIIETGCLPEEFAGRSEVIQAEFKGDDPLQGRTARQHILRTKGIGNHISMSNQMFITRWDSLSRNEIGIFLQFVKSYSTTLGDSLFKGNIPKLELAAILSAIFWLSRPLEEVCSMRLQTSSGGEELAYVFRKGKKEHSYWQINGDLLETYKFLRGRLQDQSFQVEPCYSMPLHPVFETIMSDYALDVLKRAPAGKSITLFPREPAAYLVEIRTFLSMVNEMKRCRLTPKKVEMAFFEYVSHSPESDISKAILITGRNHQLGATALHYTSQPIKKLQKTCLTVFYELCFDFVGVQSPALRLSDFNLPGDSEAFAGSTVCPTKETVKELARSLKERLEVFRRQYDATFDRLSTLHNDMTIYTLCMLGFATGYLTWTIAGMLTPHGENLPVPLSLGIFLLGLRRLEVSRLIATTFRCPAPFINAGLSDAMLLGGGLNTVRFGRLKDFLLHARRVPLTPSGVRLLRSRFLPDVSVCFRHRQPPLYQFKLRRGTEIFCAFVSGFNHRFLMKNYSLRHLRDPSDGCCCSTRLR